MKTAIILAVTLGIALAQNHQGRNYQHPNQYNHHQQQQPQPQLFHQKTQSLNRNSYNYQPEQVEYEEPQPQQQQQIRTRQEQDLQDDRKIKATPIPILRWNKQMEHDGTYSAGYETGNNIISEEHGFLKKIGQGDDQTETLVQSGSYSYMTPDGQLITTHYTADENGFHATGDHIPTSPPVSPEIQKGLDLIYAGIRQQQEAAARETQLNPHQQQTHQQYNKQQESDGRYRN